MCGPVALAVTSIVSTVLSTAMQAKQASDEQEAINKSADARAEQISDEKAQEGSELAREARRQRARIRVAAGESGLAIGSGSVEAALMDSLHNQDQNIGTVGANLGAALRGNESERQSSLARVSQPNYAAAGLQIAQAGYNGYKGKV